MAAVPLTEAARGGRLELPLLGTTLAFWRASFGKPLLTVELELKMAPDAADSMRCRRVATKSGAGLVHPARGGGAGPGVLVSYFGAPRGVPKL